jgi:DNA-directed RNA polymerase beta subunit
MAQTYAGQKRIRKFYGKIREVLDMPNLIEVQKSSYDLFLNSGDAELPTDGEGIMGVFQSVFPIKDFNETAVLEFVKYELEAPKYDVEECQQRDMTYSAPLKVTLRLIVFDVDEDTGAKSVKDIKEQDVFMGDMPLMTPNGTFIVNGTERVIVSQMHRSPGRVLRPRQGQDPFLGQAAVRLPHHSLSRLLARFRVRRQGHRLRPHRPPPQAAGDDAALCAGPRPGRHHGCLLRHGRLQACEEEQGLGHQVLPRARARHPARHSTSSTPRPAK